jgi:hypothetical protein
MLVPPFMDERWRAMRARLNLAAAHCEAASDASTLEEIAHQTSLAYGELHRADFLRDSIQREEMRRGRDQEQVDQ